ncbi:MAG: DUF4139 domain-containing protein [Ectothiorhodospiraceae bacterium]|nr:DUF4139 domain-containing protein [Ectothiorhodospiraceae bacterium]
MLLSRFAATLVVVALSHPLHAAAPSGADEPPRIEVSSESQRESRQSSAQDRKSLTLTIYQNGQALVHDRREVGLVSGLNRLALLDVSPQLRVETLQVHGEHPLVIRSQRLERGLLTRQTLLDAHVGRMVELRRSGDGNEQVLEGVLRSAAEGQAVVEMEHGIEVIDRSSPWRLVFPALPAGLRAEPGLVLDLEPESPGRQALEMLYLTGGLGWQADYVVKLEDDELRLMGWATLDNNTGTAFRNARVRLVAGSPSGRGGDMPMTRQLMVAEADMPTEQAEGDYRLYTLDGAVDLGDAQRSQLPLFSETRLPVEREYRLQEAVRGQDSGGPRRQPVTVHLRFDTESEDGARALPAGTARVYQQGSDGEQLFLGEDRLPATAAGGEVELTVGTAFDVTATREQTAYRRLGERAEEQGWTLSLRNTLDRDVRVRVVEQIMGDWTLLDASQDPLSEQGRQLVWTVDVPAQDSVELRYRVEVRR